MIELSITRQCLLLAHNLTFESKDELSIAAFGNIKVVFKKKGNWVVINEIQLSKDNPIELHLDTEYETKNWVHNYGCVVAALMYILKVSYAVCGKSVFNLDYSSAEAVIPTIP